MLPRDARNTLTQEVKHVKSVFLTVEKHKVQTCSVAHWPPLLQCWYKFQPSKTTEISQDQISLTRTGMH